MGITAIFFVLNFVNRNNFEDDLSVKISGNIEINDAQVSFKLAGQVLERLVSEGENISLGQTIARLESKNLAQEVILKKAEMQMAKANLDELLAGSRPEEIAQASASAENKQACGIFIKGVGIEILWPQMTALFI